MRDELAHKRQLELGSRTQPVASLPALANKRNEIVFKDTRNSELNGKLDRVQEAKKTVNKILQDAILSLKSVKVQINVLKSEQGILIKKRENKWSSMRWLQEQKTSKFGEELAQINQVINDMKETISELSTQIDELQEKINAQNKQAKQMSAQLILKEGEKDQLAKMERHIQIELIEVGIFFQPKACIILYYSHGSLLIYSIYHISACVVTKS